MLAFGFGGGTGGLAHVLGHTVQLIGRGVVGKGIGGIQRVLAELLREFGRAFLNLGKAQLGFTLQLRARQHEIAHGMVPGGALLHVERGRVDGLVLGVQPLVGAQARPELGDLGQDSL